LNFWRREETRERDGEFLFFLIFEDAGKEKRRKDGDFI